PTKLAVRDEAVAVVLSSFELLHRIGVIALSNDRELVVGRADDLHEPEEVAHDPRIKLAGLDVRLGLTALDQAGVRQNLLPLPVPEVLPLRPVRLHSEAAGAAGR